MSVGLVTFPVSSFIIEYHGSSSREGTVRRLPFDEDDGPSREWPGVLGTCGARSVGDRGRPATMDGRGGSGRLFVVFAAPTIGICDRVAPVGDDEGGTPACPSRGGVHDRWPRRFVVWRTRTPDEDVPADERVASANRGSCDCGGIDRHRTVDPHPEGKGSE